MQQAVRFGVAGALCLLVSVAMAGSACETKVVDANGASDDHFGGPAETGAMFGPGIAADADVLVIGSPGDDVGTKQNRGSAAVFRRVGAAWIEEAELLASQGAAHDRFGASVAVSGDIIVVGAPEDVVGPNLFRGSATVFRRLAAAWIEEATLQPSEFAMHFGGSVAVSENVIVVGALHAEISGEQSQGSATVFRWNGVSWILEQTLVSSSGDANDFFGTSVAIDGDDIVVGAPTDGLGLVTTFHWDGHLWIEGATLSPNQPLRDPGFGRAVSLHENDLVVGAWAGAVSGGGAAFAFERTSSGWLEQALPLAPGSEALDFFGCSIAVLGDLIVVGALRDDVGTAGDQGTATVYRRTGGVWVFDTQLAASDGGADDRFGASVALVGDSVLVAAPWKAVGSEPEQGAVYVYDLSPSPWADLGGGTMGAAGLPALVGTGPLVAGTQYGLTLMNAPPGALLVGWLTTTPAPFAALGGVVHAYPFANQFLFTANTAGTLQLSQPWRPGIPSCTQIVYQFFVDDPSAPFGITLSNGLLATPP